MGDAASSLPRRRGGLMNGRVTLLSDLLSSFPLVLGPLDSSEPAVRDLSAGFAGFVLEVWKCDICLNQLAGLCAQSAKRAATVDQALRACDRVMAQCRQAYVPPTSAKPTRRGE